MHNISSESPITSAIRRGAFLGLLLALLIFGAWQPAHATILVSDDFPTNGSLAGRTPAVGGIWTTISGTANETTVVNGYALLSDVYSEDLESGFTSISSGSLFLGFDLIVSDPGAYTGTDFEYFIHFSGSTFSARTDIAAFSASGFRPGIATASSTAEAVWPVDLAYGTSHRIVIRFDFSTGLVSLWVDPSALSDSHIISTNTVTGITIDAVNLRQSSASPDQSLRIGRLRVATTFDEARILPPSPDLSWYGDGINAGGTGTWSSTGNQWSNSGGAPGAWDASKNAIFDTTSGTVTVDAAGIDAEAGLSFEVDGYTLTGGPLNLGTGNNPISVATSSTANLANVLAGTVTSVQKTGLGTLTLSGENTFTGPIQINQGSLQITADGALGNEDNDLVFGGGALTIPSDVVLGNSRALSGNALFSIDGGQSLSVSGSHNTTATKLTDTGTLNLLGSVRNVGAVEFEAAGVLTGAGALVGTGLTAPLLTTGTARVLQAIDLSGSSETIDVGSGGTLKVEQSLTASNTLTKEGSGTLVLEAASSINRLQIGQGGFSFTQGGTVRVNHVSQLGNNTIYHNYGTVEPAAPINTSVGIEFGGRSSTEAVIGGSGGNQALVVSGPIDFYGPSGSGDMVVRINNETTFSNTVTLSTSASISGWTVRGTGELTLSGDSSATLDAPVTLADSVRLNMTGAIGADLTLNAQTRLLGSGAIGGSVAGAGTVAPDASILTVNDLDPSAGMDFEMLLSESTPDYTDTAAANNSVVRLKSASPLLASLDSDNAINVFFSVANLNDGDEFKGGFFTDQASDFLSQIQSATYAYYFLGDGNGSDITKNGQGYYALASEAPNLSVEVATEPETAAFASGTINGQVMVFSLPVVAPGAPTIGTASSPDSGEISVAFTAPTSTGGSAITAYNATCTSSDGGASGSQSGPSSPLTVTSLTNGKTYTCTVTATNSAGTSAASSASNSVVPTSGQTITFANPGAQNFGTTPTLTATATSGLTVTFTSSTTDVCTITSGGALTFVTTGTCTVDADQAGNDAFEQATTVSQSFTVQDPFPSGTGTHDDPYQITNWNHLNAMRNDLDAYYQLANDLTTQTIGYEAHASAAANGGQGWLPLGPTLSTPFSGALDGQGHTIQGLTINSANDYTGLFGVYRPKFAAEEEATIQIKSLGLLDVNISGTEYAGALIGYLETPFISNDDTDEDISAKYAATLVQDVFVSGGTVEGTINVGGLIGYNNNRIAQRIYSNVAVTGVDAVGGLVGTSFGSIFDCFALGSVQLSSSATVPPNPKGLGGLMGYNDRAIERCYATGHVDDSESSGGLFGTAWIEPNNYWDTQTTGQQSSTGTNEGPNPDAKDSGGLSSVQLKTLNQIATTWDFETVWTITDPATGAIAYPTLRSMLISPAPGLTTTPGTPTLISPADGDTEVDVATTLAWSDPVLADNFVLELETSDGSVTVFSGEIIGETEKTPSLLQGNTTYRWRVRGINTTHDSSNPVLGPFSDYATFTTGSRPDEIFSDRFRATDP